MNGTFVATTANALEFGDQGSFSASEHNTNVALLTIQPSALRFQERQAATIRSEITNLRVPDRRSILFAGGSIELINSRFFAQNGHIHLVGVGGSGLVNIARNGRQFQIPDSLPLANITLTGRLGSLLVSGAGDISINASTLRMFPASGLIADTQSEMSGSISVRASDWVNVVGGLISNNSTADVDTPGRIDIQAGRFIRLNRSDIRSLASGAGNGGRINISSEQIILNGGSGITAQTQGLGNAGNIRVVADESLLLSSSNIVSSAQVQGRSLGNAGNIAISTPHLVMEEGASLTAAVIGEGGRGGNIAIQSEFVTIVSSVITASTTSSEPGGIVDIQAEQLRLSNSRIRSLTTNVGDGGNIQLRDIEFLLLEEDSSISAEALTDGNGGNLDIESGLIVAVPNQNNDLIANANNGDGGNIQITTRGIFGIEPRPLDVATNDINASSKFGTDGVVQINRLEVDPSQGLSDLPDAVVDVAGLIERGLCRETQVSQFVVTGRGGVPPSASEALESGDLWEDWRLSLVDESPQTNLPQIELPQTDLSTGRSPQSDQLIASLTREDDLVEAQGWLVDAEGKVILVAESMVSSPAIARDRCS